MFEEEVLKEIGVKYNKTPAQVMLRWQIQRNTVVIPKSVRYERMLENIDVFDFVLSNEDMDKIKTINKDLSSFFAHNQPETVERFVQILEERR